MRYALSGEEWTAIKPMLPNKPRGVRRLNNRRVLNGIFWILRSGAPWRDLPNSFGPYTTCYNRFERFFNKIKHCRRVATRYDKLAANYLAFVQLASIRLWLRTNDSTSQLRAATLLMARRQPP